MKTAFTSLFENKSTKQEATISWARQRSDRELRRFIDERHGRLASIDLALDEI